MHQTIREQFVGESSEAETTAESESISYLYHPVIPTQISLASHKQQTNKPMQKT